MQPHSMQSEENFVKGDGKKEEIRKREKGKNSEGEDPRTFEENSQGKDPSTFQGVASSEKAEGREVEEEKEEKEKEGDTEKGNGGRSAKRSSQVCL